jgi:hypothetical protein
MRTHQEIDQRSLAMHRLVASKVRQNPQLFLKVQGTLARWRQTVCEASQPYLQEWERLMGQGMDACLAVAVEDSPRADALRQASPFAGVLSHHERFQFLKTWRAEHDT